MSLYELIIILSQIHQKMKGGGYSDGLKFDQFHHKISVGKTVIYDRGIVPQTINVCETDFILDENMSLTPGCENPYKKLEELYKSFKYSVSDPYADCLVNNFVSKKNNDLNFLEFVDGKKRTVARAELEAFVMLTEFPWDNPNHHYWQSGNDKNLILYKEWSTVK